MKRDLSALGEMEYDLAIIGGGVYGASLAWEAASRGLSVALLEKEDFASATSANSLKIIHGGFRYLQHADIARMRASMKERAFLMHAAPHLVHPLPVLVPTYGHGLRGREAFFLALRANDILGFDRNRLIDPQKHIPPGRLLSEQDCLKEIPGLPETGLAGGAVFYDAQVYNSERLVLAYLLSARENGAVIANYARVDGFLQSNGRVHGVVGKDTLTDETFEVRARLVVNTSGPWIEQVLRSLQGSQTQGRLPLAKAYNLVTRPLFPEYAVGLFGDNGYQDRDAVVDKGSSMLFVAPWRGFSLVGTWYGVFQGNPEDFRPEEQDILALIDAINRAYPPAKLTLNEVHHVHAGLLPAQSSREPVELMKHFEIREHRNDGAEGLLSVVGVKYTTARGVAEKTVNKAFDLLGKKLFPSISARAHLSGGEIEDFESFLSQAKEERLCGLDEQNIISLVKNYGSSYPEVLQYFDRTGTGGELQIDQALLRAQIRYSVQNEMAKKLSDIVFRRTELGSAGHPGESVLLFAARLMAEELGWSKTELHQELQEVERKFSWNG